MSFDAHISCLYTNHLCTDINTKNAHQNLIWIRKEVINSVKQSCLKLKFQKQQKKFNHEIQLSCCLLEHILTVYSEGLSLPSKFEKPHENNEKRTLKIICRVCQYRFQVSAPYNERFHSTNLFMFFSSLCPHQ